MTRGDRGAPARPKVAVVLGSGGIKSSASIGLWKVLQRERIEVDMLIGCSGGSLFAGLFANGCDVEGAATYAREGFNRELTAKYQPWSIVRGLFPRLFGFDETVGLVSDRRLQRIMGYLYGDATFADCSPQLRLVATDIETGETVVLSEGRLGDAVRASISLPLLWRPWRIGGRLLFDGGASNPLPIDVAVRERMEIIIAMGFASAKLPHIGSLADLARQTSNIVQSSLLKTSFAFNSMVHHSEVIPVMPDFDRSVGLGDGSDVPYLISRGEEAAEEQVPYLRKLLKTPREVTT